MVGQVALQLVQVARLEPMHKNVDDVKIDVVVYVCHGGLLYLISCCYGSHDPPHAKINHCANAQKTCDLFTLGNACLAPSMGEAFQAMPVLRRMDISSTGIGGNELAQRYKIDFLPLEGERIFVDSARYTNGAGVRPAVVFPRQRKLF